MRLTLSFLLAFVGLNASIPLAQGESKKRTIEIQLSVGKQRSLEDLNTLNEFDILGVDYNSGKAQVHASSSEIARIVQLGFHISFAPQSQNFSTQSLSGYTKPDEIIAYLDETQAAYPDIVRVFEAGKTIRGRSIRAVEISYHLGDETKPVVYFNSMHHAREVMTAEVALDIIKTLTEGASNNSEIAGWLEKYRIVVLPQVNPDGNHIVHTTDNMWRKNAQGDDSSTWGVDLNRNYPAYFNHCSGSSGSKSSQTYRGPHAGSEPETKAMMNLVSTYKPVLSISYHSYSELIIVPFGCENVKNDSRPLFNSVSKQMNESIKNDKGVTGKYTVGTAPEILYSADGTDADWYWQEEGVVSFVIEVNSSKLGFQPDYKKWRDVTVENQRGGWMSIIRRMESQAVTGFAVHDGSGAHINFKLRVKSENSFVPFAAEREHFTTKNQTGLFYQVLLPGKYEMDFIKEGAVLKTLSFEVGEGVTNLGFHSL